MDLNYSNFCEALVFSDPEASLLRQCHLNEYVGELPHVFMGDWCRLIIQRYRDNSTYQLPGFTGDILEAARLSLDPALHDLIFSSFLENMAPEKDIASRLAKDIPPPLATELRQFTF